MKKLLAAVFVASLFVQAGLAAQGSMLKMKNGTCGFKVMDANGVKPISEARVVIADTIKGQTISEAVTDASGRCKIEIETGHYILKVNDQVMAVVRTDAENTVTTCHVMLKQPVVVGQAGEEDLVGGALLGGGGGGGGATILGLTPTTVAVVGGGIAVVGGGVVVAEHNKSSSGGSN